MTEGDLRTLDDALIRLRRLWATPPPGTHWADAVGDVEMSTVLVVDAIHRGSGPGAVSVADVAHRLDVAPSTASRLVERAVTAGVVSRGSSQGDARRVTLSLTPAGHALVTRAERFRVHYLTSLLDGWPHDDVRCLSTLLARFADAVHHHPLPPGRTTA